MNVDINKYWIDSHLKFMIAKALEKDIKDITKESLKTVENLDLSHCLISNLHGLEYATNLKELNLNKNNIVDASLLSNLKKLIDLELSENKISNTSFLGELVNLKTIFLDSNNISKINNLDNLRNLSYINLSNNKISDLSFINRLISKNIQVIASEQCIVLNPLDIIYGESIEFSTPIKWDEHTPIYLDNIQVSGEYEFINSDQKPYLSYSISKLKINNILSNCIIKAEFYHEVLFEKSGIFSGIIIQPIAIKEKSYIKYFSQSNNSSIYGNININTEFKSKSEYEYILKNKLVTLINSCGQKVSCLTDRNGLYKFLNLNKGRYTLLFPFFSEYKYITPSLYVCVLEDNHDMEVNCTLDKV